MNVLITGGSGLLGEEVSRKVRELGHEPIVFDLRKLSGDSDIASVVGDVLDWSGLVQAIRQFHIEVIVHLAGMLTPSVRNSPLRGIQINYGGTAQVLEAARLENVRRVVLSSSNTVYDHGAISGRPMQETDPLEPRSVYATTKLAAEWTGRNYAALYGLEFVAIRLAALFGPGQSQSGVAGLWIDPLIHGLLNDGKADVVKHNRVWMEYVYVKDAAVAFAKAAVVETLEYPVANVGDGELTQFVKILEILGQLIQEAHINVVEQGQEVSLYKEATDPMDLQRAHKMFGYVPQFKMPEALADYIAELRERK